MMWELLGFIGVLWLASPVVLAGVVIALAITRRQAMRERDAARRALHTLWQSGKITDQEYRAALGRTAPYTGAWGQGQPGWWSPAPGVPPQAVPNPVQPAAFTAPPQPAVSAPDSAGPLAAPGGQPIPGLQPSQTSAWGVAAPIPGAPAASGVQPQPVPNSVQPAAFTAPPQPAVPGQPGYIGYPAASQPVPGVASSQNGPGSPAGAPGAGPQPPQTSAWGVAAPMPGVPASPGARPQPAPGPVRPAAFTAQPQLAVPRYPGYAGPPPVSSAAPRRRPASAANVVLVIGVLFILLAGIIFATTTWQILPNLTRTVIILLFSAFFFGTSLLMQRRFRLRQAGMAFHLLGGLFLPVTVLCAGYFQLFGPWFSLQGEGCWLLGALGALLLGAAAVAGTGIYRSLGFGWVALGCLTGVVVCTALFFSPSPGPFSLCLAVYCAFLVLAGGSLRRLGQQGAWGRYGLLLQQADLFALLNLIGCGALSLWGAGGVSFVLSTLLYGALFLTPALNDSRLCHGGVGAYPFTAFLLLAVWRLHPAGEGALTSLFLLAAALVVLLSAWGIFGAATCRGLAIASLVAVGVSGGSALLLQPGWNLWMLLAAALLALTVTVQALREQPVLRWLPVFFWLAVAQGATALLPLPAGWEPAVMAALATALFLLLLLPLPGGRSLRTLVSDITLPVTVGICWVVALFCRPEHGLAAAVLLSVQLVWLARRYRPMRWVLPHLYVPVTLSLWLVWPEPVGYTPLVCCLALTLLAVAALYLPRLSSLREPLCLAAGIHTGFLFFALLAADCRLYPACLWMVVAYWLARLLRRGASLRELSFWLATAPAFLAAPLTLRQLAPLLPHAWLWVAPQVVCLVLLSCYLWLPGARNSRFFAPRLLWLGVGAAHLATVFTISEYMAASQTALYGVLPLGCLLLASLPLWCAPRSPGERALREPGFWLTMMNLLWLLPVGAAKCFPALPQPWLLAAPALAALGMLCLCRWVPGVRQSRFYAPRLFWLGTGLAHLLLAAATLCFAVRSSLPAFYGLLPLGCLLLARLPFCRPPKNLGERVVKEGGFWLAMIALLWLLPVGAAKCFPALPQPWLLVAPTLLALGMLCLYSWVPRVRQSGFYALRLFWLGTGLAHLLALGGTLWFVVCSNLPAFYGLLPLGCILLACLPLWHKRWNPTALLPLYCLYPLARRALTLGLQGDTKMLAVNLCFAGVGLVLAMLGRVWHRSLLQQGQKAVLVDWFTILAAWGPLRLLFAPQPAWRFAAWLLLAGYALLYLGKVSSRGERLAWTAFALAVGCAWWAQPFGPLPVVLAVEYALLPPALVLVALGRWIWRRQRPVFGWLLFGYGVLAIVVLAVDALRYGRPADALLLGVGALALLLASFALRQKRWFLLSSATLVLLGIYLSRRFWLSLAWWVYLLAAGVLLVSLATVNELCRQRGAALKGRLSALLRDWSW